MTHPWTPSPEQPYGQPQPSHGPQAPYGQPLPVQQPFGHPTPPTSYGQPVSPGQGGAFGHPTGGQFGVAAQPGPGGLLRVQIQGSAMSSSLITPSLMLNGYLVSSRYGANDFHLPPGRHQVFLYAQWMRQYGQAHLEVDVHPGQVSEVFYAAPLHQFTTGSIGVVKQTRKGLWPMLALLGVAFGLPIIALILMILS